MAGAIHCRRGWKHPLVRRQSAQGGLSHLRGPVTIVPAPPGVVLGPQALQAIGEQLRAVDDGCETGGILLGHEHDDGTIAVRHAGGPGQGAVRTPSFFLRDRAHAQQLADDAYQRDGSIWVGDWHSHPRTPPVPSDLDLTTYRQLLADPDLRFAVFVALIIGTGPNGLTAAAWACTPARALPAAILSPRHTACLQCQSSAAPPPEPAEPAQ